MRGLEPANHETNGSREAALHFLSTEGHLTNSKMTFHLRGNGGNYVGAEWIAAEGEIVEETADDLESYLKSFGHTENPGGWSVRLNSPGESLSGGIRLGEMIRKLKLDTETGGTEPDGIHWKRVPGYCASACAFAFLGGHSRDASANELGVHQFYDELSLRDPTAKVFNSLDMSQHQVVSAILIDFVFRMGVDPRLVSIASSTLPAEMKFLDEKTLDDLSVNWHPKQFQPWSIEPSRKGVIAVTRSKDKTRTATIAYFADGIPRLSIEDWHNSNIDAQWLNDATKVIESVVAFDMNFPKEVLRVKFQNEILVLEFALKGVDGKAIAASKWSGVSVNGPQYMWGPFTYVLPKKNAESTIRVASINCI